MTGTSVGQASPGRRSASSRRARYSCFLAGGVAPAFPAISAEPRVAVGVDIQVGSTPSARIVHRAPSRSRFLPGYPLVWVTEPVTDLVLPYWAPRHWTTLLVRLRPGQVVPPIGAEPLAALVAAGAVVDSHRDLELQGRRLGELDAARAQFSTASYAAISGLIPPGHLAALASYHRRLVRDGGLTLGDGQCDRRYGIHNEPVARFFMAQLRAAVERVVGAAVTSAYTYTVMYQPGAVLPAHTDRDQCEYTVSLLVDATPDAGTDPWPLWLEVDGVPVAVRQRVGDALIFAGRRLRHWRDPLPDDRTSTSLLLHFVPAGFTGRLR